MKKYNVRLLEHHDRDLDWVGKGQDTEHTVEHEVVKVEEVAEWLHSVGQDQLRLVKDFYNAIEQ